MGSELATSLRKLTETSNDVTPDKSTMPLFGVVPARKLAIKLRPSEKVLSVTRPSSDQRATLFPASNSSVEPKDRHPAALRYSHKWNGAIREPPTCSGFQSSCGVRPWSWRSPGIANDTTLWSA